MNKNDKLQLTKDKLITATIKLMEETDDPFLVTSREIAAEADCRPAMINYCFGSREELIYCVFEKLYTDYLKSPEFTAIINSDISPKEVLKQLHFLVSGFLIDNYKFTKALTGFVLFKRNLSREAFSYQYVLRHYNGRKNEEECKVIAYELSTMMQLIIYRKDDFEKTFGIDLNNKDELRKLIDLRVDLLLGE